mgnify:CR=1 FL=1
MITAEELAEKYWQELRLKSMNQTLLSSDQSKMSYLAGFHEALKLAGEIVKSAQYSNRVRYLEEEITALAKGCDLGPVE